MPSLADKAQFPVQFCNQPTFRRIVSIMPRGGKVQQRGEFGGPLGAVFIMVSLPLIIVFLYYGCGRWVPGVGVGSALFSSAF